ncbi:MAG: hypothetical protein C0448_09305 [Sphingobacteriaceae bacterium]|nr:hypothetical protein [Sphingobacteriaceae bacterium]
MKLIFIGIIFTTVIFTKTENIKVYVCGESKIYHPTKDHSALGRCKHSIFEMTEKEAIKQGKKECKCKS